MGIYAFALFNYRVHYSGLAIRRLNISPINAAFLYCIFIIIFLNVFEVVIRVRFQYLEYVGNQRTTDFMLDLFGGFIFLDIFKSCRQPRS